jgi:hypothetical protein
VGFVVVNVALGQVFSKYFGFPCQSLFTKFFILTITGAGIIGQKWPMCRVDPVWTPPTPICKIKRKVPMTMDNVQINNIIRIKLYYICVMQKIIYRITTPLSEIMLLNRLTFWSDTALLRAKYKGER